MQTQSLVWKKQSSFFQTAKKERPCTCTGWACRLTWPFQRLMFKTHQNADCCSGLWIWNLLQPGSGSADHPEVLNTTNSLSQMVQQRGKWGFWNAERKTRPCNCWSWYSSLECWTVHLTYAATHYFPARQRPPRVSYICQMLCCSFSTTNMGDCVKKDMARTRLQEML